MTAREISPHQSASSNYSLNHLHRDSKKGFDVIRAHGSNKDYSYDFNDMITILVGEEEHPFTVHKDMLCAKSKFFKAACSRIWASGREKVVRPPEGTPQQFQMYVSWVYSSRLDVDAEDPDKQLADLIGMFILGDVLDDHQLRNATMQCLITTTLGSTHSFSVDQLDKVYAATPVGSPLRQFVVWWLLVNVKHDSLKDNVAQYPEELVQELALASLERTAVLNDRESVRLLKLVIKPEKEAV